MDDKLKTKSYTYDHWIHSALAFSVIINLVTLKLFLEISYWNVIAV
jgi:amino acid permease